MPPHLTPSEGFYDPISENSRQLHHRQPFKKKVYETPEMPPPSPPPPPPSAIRKFSWTVSGIHGHRFRPFVERGVLRVKRIWCLIQDHNAVI